MYKNNTPYISLRYRKQDYLNINLTVDSADTDFEAAIDIFRDRITGRFLDQIHFLSTDCNKNGFAIMAIECLLIETLAQFRNGLDDTVGVSARVYSDFLYHDLGICPVRSLATRFYRNIRCGILHQAQTKPQRGLTFGGSTAMELHNDFLMVSVDRFVEAVDVYFSEYCSDLLDPANYELRINFIKKMNFICNR